MPEVPPVFRMARISRILQSIRSKFAHFVLQFFLDASSGGILPLPSLPMPLPLKTAQAVRNGWVQLSFLFC